MKFSSSLALAMAPAAMARSFAAREITRHLERRTNHVVEAPPAAEMPAHAPAPAPAAPEHPPAKEVVVAPEQPPAHVAAPAAGKHEIIQVIWVHMGGEIAKTETIREKVTVTQTVVAGGHATAVPGKDGAMTTVKEGETATVPNAGAASHTVTVGGEAGLVFTPQEMSVPAGDVVVFEFLSKNHTVTQSAFDKPCEALPDGMDSGFIPNPDNSVVPAPQVAMQVMDDKPVWFYCAQGPHCGMGMVFSINPTAEKTHAMFQQKAIEQNGKGEGTPITGGEGAPPPAKGSDAAAAPPPADGTATAAPPADTAVAPPTATGNVPGQGQIKDGSCVCMVSCSAQGFPAAAQGLNARGGMAGSLPMMGAMS